jgi:hypothetical protein
MYMAEATRLMARAPVNASSQAWSSSPRPPSTSGTNMSRFFAHWWGRMARHRLRKDPGAPSGLSLSCPTGSTGIRPGAKSRLDTSPPSARASMKPSGKARASNPAIS